MKNFGVGISSFRRPQTAKPRPVMNLENPRARPKSSKSTTSLVDHRRCPLEPKARILRFHSSENCIGDGPKINLNRPNTAKGAKKWETIVEDKCVTKIKPRPSTAPAPTAKQKRSYQITTQVQFKL